MKNIKNKKIKYSTEILTRKIWLAGLGASAKGYEVLNRKAKLISTESNIFFDNLVNNGSQIEKELKISVSKNDRLINFDFLTLLCVDTDEVFS